MKARYLTAALALLPTLAFAHPGHGLGHDLQPGFVAGVLHPFTGLDHLAVMLAVGVWAAQLGGRLRYALPASFIVLMLAGAMLGISGVHIGASEQGIAASICVMGLLLAFAVRLPAAASVLLISSFAVFHGYAHGIEAPHQTNIVAYLSGFAMSTAALHVVGLAIGAVLLSYEQSKTLRWAGAAMTLGGLALFAS